MDRIPELTFVIEARMDIIPGRGDGSAGFSGFLFLSPSSSLFRWGVRWICLFYLEILSGKRKADGSRSRRLC